MDLAISNERKGEQTQEPANAIKITRLNNFKKSHYAKTKYKHCSNTNSGEAELNAGSMVGVRCWYEENKYFATKSSLCN